MSTAILPNHGASAVEIVLCIIVSVVWTTLFTGLLWFFRERVIGKKLNAGQKLNENIPLLLPLCAFGFTCVTVLGIMVWRYNVKHSETLSLTSNSWFSAGWQHGLNFFGIPIDSWLKYTVVLNYQISRVILGSMLSNIFRPFLIARVQNQMVLKDWAKGERARILFAQGFVTIFGFSTTLTDLFLYLSQVDLALISLFINLVADWASTLLLMNNAATSADFKNEQLQRNFDSLEQNEALLASIKIKPPPPKDFDV